MYCDSPSRSLQHVLWNIGTLQFSSYFQSSSREKGQLIEKVLRIALGIFATAYTCHLFMPFLPRTVAAIVKGVFIPLAGCLALSLLLRGVQFVSSLIKKEDEDDEYTYYTTSPFRPRQHSSNYSPVTPPPSRRSCTPIPSSTPHSNSEDWSDEDEDDSSDFSSPDFYLNNENSPPNSNRRQQISSSILEDSPTTTPDRHSRSQRVANPYSPDADRFGSVARRLNFENC